MAELFRLDRKVAMITGAASGIGRAIAHVFAQQGAQVCVVDIQETQAQLVAQEISDAGHQAFVYQADVTNAAAVQQLVKRICTERGGIHILVNSAGISHIGRLENTTEADFDRVFAVNVKGTFLCMQAALPVMKQQQQGVILNLASIAAHVGLPDRFAYSMTKGAVYAMTLSVAKDYIHDHIRCNSISPARVHTPFVDGFLQKNYPGREKEMFEKLSATQPIGRMATPEEVAWLALYLCSDEASFITGCDYPIDGGFIKLNN
ncbi:NAD(P)-dependent dehydrogenase (short-subunit alcohol dehydrogenase family) [Thermoflavifilum aggregans]|uniref:NAD(P)-dependent dehydrogenase (Short-subunit alcohol dehydrogenase family) n=1 Tax=Thermoflavifilum aggregans TaxID=454188 RepID=A0A2M9CV70_9BACT|nr:SDR family oxidoreductase [Thermoflavifilum aggregans]PJJ75802.1 NAD(P)-dependent dehydrogenase (short-subunit alcohol dehydrogenase family) [Thermoflavifilum aggregans]